MCHVCHDVGTTQIHPVPSRFHRECIFKDRTKDSYQRQYVFRALSEAKQERSQRPQVSCLERDVKKNLDKCHRLKDEVFNRFEEERPSRMKDASYKKISKYRRKYTTEMRVHTSRDLWNPSSSLREVSPRMSVTSGARSYWCLKVFKMIAGSLRSMSNSSKSSCREGWTKRNRSS